MIPALIVIAAGADTLQTLVASQVVLSLVLPFAVVPLVSLTSRRDVMRDLVNGPVIRALAIGVAALVIAMNVVLLCGPSPPPAERAGPGQPGACPKNQRSSGSSSSCSPNGPTSWVRPSSRETSRSEASASLAASSASPISKPSKT